MNFRRVLFSIIKITLVFFLIWWMVNTGKLDFGQVKVVLESPVILTASVLLWAGGYLIAGGLRWYLLLRGLGLRIAFPKILSLQLIGFFFNTAIPGAVGGDLIKAFYVIREQEGDRKTPAMLTILLDRIVGLAALFFLAAIACSLKWRIFSSPQLIALFVFSVLGVVSILSAFLWVMLMTDGKDPIKWLLNYRLPGIRILKGVYEALRSYRHCPRYLIGAFALSLVIQCGALIYARFLTSVLTGVNPELGIFSVIFPLGVMTTALPLAPGGLGVGHMAFEKLYSLVGLSGGANVFNVMVLSQLSLNMFGIFPYLMFRREGIIPDANMTKEVDALSG